jgi:hypothetical protein
VWDERLLCDLAPVDVDRREHEQIGEQRERQPSQHLRIAVIWDRDFECQHERSHADRQHGCRQRHNELRRCSHRRDVGRDIERIRERHERDREVQDWPSESLSDARREPFAASEAEPCRELLHTRGEGSDIEGRPHQTQPELRADLGVRADPRRVVVGRPGDQSRTETLEVPVPPKPPAPDMMFESGSTHGAKSRVRQNAAQIDRR